MNTATSDTHHEKMQIFYISTSQDRFDQFKRLVPYKSSGIIVPRYLIEHKELCFEEANIYYRKLKKIYDCLVVMDHELLEIRCLNKFPNCNFSSIYDLGLGTIETLLKLKGRGAVHKTNLHVIFKKQSTCKFSIKSQISGSIIEGLPYYGDLDLPFTAPSDIFVPSGHIQTLGSMDFQDRTDCDSLTQAANKLVDLMISLQMHNILDAKT